VKVNFTALIIALASGIFEKYYLLFD